MSAIFLKSAFRAADIPESDKPQIALLGRSNVGKSSLINHLAGQKNLARTSAQPGLTQAINLYAFDGRYLLVDLPGYGYAKAARSRGKGFADMLGEYLSEADLLRLVLLVVDGRHGLTESDRHVLGQLLKQGIPVVVIFNKIDKLSSSAAALALRQARTEYPALTFIPHSTYESTGLGEVRDAIERAVRGQRG